MFCFWLPGSGCLILWVTAEQASLQASWREHGRPCQGTLAHLAPTGCCAPRICDFFECNLLPLCTHISLGTAATPSTSPNIYHDSFGPLVIRRLGSDAGFVDRLAAGMGLVPLCHFCQRRCNTKAEAQSVQRLSPLYMSPQLMKDETALQHPCKAVQVRSGFLRSKIREAR